MPSLGTIIKGADNFASASIFEGRMTWGGVVGDIGVVGGAGADTVSRISIGRGTGATIGEGSDGDGSERGGLVSGRGNNATGFQAGIGDPAAKGVGEPGATVAETRRTFGSRGTGVSIIAATSGSIGKPTIAAARADGCGAAVGGDRGRAGSCEGSSGVRAGGGPVGSTAGAVGSAGRLTGGGSGGDGSVSNNVAGAGASGSGGGGGGRVLGGVGVGASAGSGDGGGGGRAREASASGSGGGSVGVGDRGGSNSANGGSRGNRGRVGEIGEIGEIDGGRSGGGGGGGVGGGGGGGGADSASGLSHGGGIVGNGGNEGGGGAMGSHAAEGELLFGFEEMMEDFGSSFNSSFNESFFSWNGSLYNETYLVLGEGMYPSGYSLPHIVLASIVVTLLMIVIVVGNMLVIIAIATEKALKNIQNWFIASLAVADFFLGLVIMPFSLANEIMGYWIFGYWWCDIYSAMDVLLCTASIMNLCLISLDRFWSITQAVDYLKKRTPARAALMIALVWLLSALVCIPPLLGWKRPTPEEKYPKCKLSEDIGYVLYSALGSFYIPSCIMVFVYIRIYFAAKARARRGIRKQPRPRPVAPTQSPNIRQTSFTQNMSAADIERTPGRTLMENVAIIENQPVQIPIVTCDFASDVSTSEAEPPGVSSSLPLEEKDTLKVSVPMPMQKNTLKATLSVNGSDDQASASSSTSASGQSSIPMRCRAPSVGIDVDMVSEFDPSSSDSGVVSRCAVVKPLKLRLCQPIFGRKAIGKLKREQGAKGGGAGATKSGHSPRGGSEGINPMGSSIEVAKPVKPRDPEREKRRLARKKEKRATLILGLIMGSFIACWLPFFFLYIVKPLFPSLAIPSPVFVIVFWLGYMNSALNPVIYTVFNKDFRRAFRRILFK